MTDSKERIKFSNQTFYLYCYIVGWGKTGPAHSFPPPKSFDLSIDQLVFPFMLLFHCILTLMNDRFQRENQVFKPNILFVLLHCGVGKDWAGPFFPPPLQNVLIFLFIFQSFSLCYSFTVWSRGQISNFEFCCTPQEEKVGYYFQSGTCLGASETHVFTKFSVVRFL